MNTVAITIGEAPGGGESKSETKVTTTIKIVSAEDKLYKALSTVTRMTMNGEMMGQPISFDSDKKDNMGSQMGKMIGGSVNKTTEITINKADGKVKEIKKDELESGIMMKGGANSTNVFLVIPTDKKVGDKWTVTDDEEGINTVKNYEVQSLKDNLVTVLINSTSKGTTTKERNGMSIEMTIDAKINGTITVDTKLGLIKKIVTETENSGSIEVMGQSKPMNNKINTTVTVE